MKLLNLCCGAVRPPEPWTNLDNLRAILPPGTIERENLDAEKNYVDHDVLSGRLPFPDDTFDGILASHCVEHWNCQQAVNVLKECRRVLKTGGEILVSVPDATYFRAAYSSGRDTPENAVELFGEPIHLPDGEKTFFGYALWNRYHQAILTDDALWCYFVRAGFDQDFIHTAGMNAKLLSIANRLKFSLVMGAVK